MREARIHVRHVRDLLKSVDPADAYNGVDCNSLSFLNTITAGDILGTHVSCNLSSLAGRKLKLKSILSLEQFKY